MNTEYRNQPQELCQLDLHSRFKLANAMRVYSLQLRTMTLYFTWSHYMMIISNFWIECGCCWTTNKSARTRRIENSFKRSPTEANTRQVLFYDLTIFLKILKENCSNQTFSCQIWVFREPKMDGSECRYGQTH
jgi:hypothetical protein